jgi:D-Lysine 5,6-aminomutase TIM-barrel domain of alpha subunit
MTSKLNRDQGAVLLARELARRAGEPVTQLALTHTTVSIERAVLRLAGSTGPTPAGCRGRSERCRAQEAPSPIVAPPIGTPRAPRLA